MAKFGVEVRSLRASLGRAQEHPAKHRGRFESECHNAGHGVPFEEFDE
ncbi:hypothetical protein [Streptomyces sp. Y1]|uniref:Uncharacterized protein n=1 Tax=Streptomyces sp. Y1 TaxID=3238634 RepID=A0AB39T951_9ACTN